MTREEYLAHRRDQSRADYEWYKAHGYCVRCHKERALPDHVMCEKCNARNSKSTYHNLYRSRLREKRLNAHLCVYCGKRPPKPRRKGCEPCLQKIREYQIKHKSKGGKS